MNADQFFSQLWDDYVRIAPAAARLRQAVIDRGENPGNDHVAFRTYDIAPINLAALEPHLLALGYRQFAPYRFEDKKLRAFGYIHPAGYPRVFLSELETAHFSPFLRETVAGLCAQVDPALAARPEVLWAGRPWAPVPFDIYEKLLAESEYAGWVAAIGLRANHFTISINSLKTFANIREFADFLESLGYALNTAGGRIKGTPEVLLEQGSTLADRVEVEFANGERHTIPTCYYEFAQRYAGADGCIYEGFVAASADKIFESTNARK